MVNITEGPTTHQWIHPVADFKLQMQFVNDIVSFLDVNADDTRVAAVSFSNFLHPEFLFNTYSTKEDVLKAIGAITHSLGDATRTYLALEHTHIRYYNKQ
jgi:hypothetical protein